MTKEEFTEMTGINPEAIVFESWDVFSKGIIGTTEDGNHVVYGFDALVNALASNYLASGLVSDPDEAATMAIEWLEFNTLRTLPYLDADVRPVIVYELQKD